METVKKAALFRSLPPIQTLQDLQGPWPMGKLVALDDDPTGVQTVHGVHVYTSWDLESLKEGLLEDRPLIFILTNSRGLSREETQKLHASLAHTLCRASKETGVPFTLLSRSDSTLRGHYPLETATLRSTLLEEGFADMDGEIIAPFFPEGGRYTIGNVHYVQDGENLIPAGETEFAKDATFGYRSSDLTDWVREKNPDYPKDAPVHAISLETLRLGGPQSIAKALEKVQNFEKVIVNSADYADMEIFVAGLRLAMQKGKRFMFRTAAGLVRVMAGIGQAPLLCGKTLRSNDSNGGLVIVGSHVQKSTRQLERLCTLPFVAPLELDVNLLTQDPASIPQTVQKIEALLKEGKTVAAYTTRKVVRVTQENSEDNLRFSVKVSEALVSIVDKLSVQPAFILAKGGITSSDIGVKGLHVRKALVAGQILPGVPVWKLGEESKYPNMHYIVFPGNVGDENAVKDVVESI